MTDRQQVKRKRGVALDDGGGLPDPLDEHLPAVADLWDYLLNLYALKERDYIYAYCDSDRFARVNQLYSSAKSVKCRFVLLTHAHHHSLRKYLDVADRFMDKYGLVIISMTWFCANDDETSAEQRRALENELAQFDSMEVTATAAPSTAAATFATITGKREQTDEVDDGLASTSAMEEERALDDEVRRIMCGDDEESDSDAAAAADETAEERLRVERLDTTTTLDSVATVRPSQIARYGDGTGRYPGSSVLIRNQILSTFFAQLILFIRHITVCDTVGVIQHKSYRLMHPYTLNKWYKELTAKP